MTKGLSPFVESTGYILGFFLTQKLHEHTGESIDSTSRHSLNIREGRKGVEGSIEQSIAINKDKLFVFFHHLEVLQDLYLLFRESHLEKKEKESKF
jgi:hypothetical protein